MAISSRVVKNKQATDIISNVERLIDALLLAHDWTADPHCWILTHHIELLLGFGELKKPEIAEIARRFELAGWNVGIFVGEFRFSFKS